uniref:Ig-like domain-containing protein n=1 Tax=Apteryx owenii TaxID=8824 RepID=A0A8B9PLW0_APTOW
AVKESIQAKALLMVSTISFVFCSFADDAMEGDALVVKCPPQSSYVRVTWYHAATKKIIPAEEEGSRIFSLKRLLWFLPTSREDSGNYTCVHPYKQGICFPSQIRYPNNTGRGQIVCPTFDNYKNATIIHFLFKDCKPLQGERYFKGDKYIFINNPREEDDGYYTCQFTYTHNGNVFNVSATRIFITKYSPLPPQILFPKDNDVIEVDLGKYRL